MNFKSISQDPRLLYFVGFIVLVAVISLIFTFIPKNNSNRLVNDVVNTSLNNDTVREEPFENRSSPSSTIVLYHASWCGYCKMFLPEWEKFRKYAQNNYNNLTVKDIKCEGSNEAICSKKGIPGYPTVILYKNADESGNNPGITFEDERSFDKLVEFINKNN